MQCNGRLLELWSRFWPVFLTSLLLSGAQIAFLAKDILTGFGGSKALEALGSSMGTELVYLLAQPFLLLLILNVLLALFACAIVSACLTVPDGGGRQRLWRTLLVLFGLWMTVLWENQRLFPGSVFAPGWQLPALLRFISLWYVWLLLLCALVVLRWRRRGRPDAVVVLLLLPLVMPPLLSVLRHHESVPKAMSSQPNVIFIGIDSLRTDVVGGIGAKSDLAPNMSKWLGQGVTFPLTYTPVARTFPSWMGILSGRYPLHSGARVNLMPADLIDKRGVLPVLMRERGYKTVYAIDEKRFSNIDESYGFDLTLGPKLGASDFLSTLYDDFPLTNTLSASAFAPYVLPAHYVNRALPLTYQPDDFQAQLRWALSQPSDKPLFMTVHFCLPHWPYVWGVTERHMDGDAAQFNYVAAVRRADAQLGALMADLKSRGYLDNALVVFLSDHGEALGLDTDSPYATENGSSPVRMYGHGYDLLSPIQNQVVLGFVGFGDMAGRIQPGVREGTAMLLDIVPTVADLLGLKVPWPVDGHSLAGALAGQEPLPERPIFMETEFDLLNMGASMPNTAKLLAEGAHLYHLTDAGHVELRRQAFDAIVKSKKRAVVHGGHILQVVPKVATAEYELADQKTMRLKRYNRAQCDADQDCRLLLDLLVKEYGSELH